MAEIKKEVYRNSGRSWFDISEDDIKKGRTEEFIVAKLREVWAMDGTDSEAASWADVSVFSVCRYLTAHPELKDLRNRLKEKPFLKARNTIVNSLGNPHFAFEYMKRKKKDEWGDKIEVDNKVSIKTFEDFLVEAGEKNIVELKEVEQKRIAPPEKIGQSISYQKNNKNKNDTLGQSIAYRK